MKPVKNCTVSISGPTNVIGVAYYSLLKLAMKVGLHSGPEISAPIEGVVSHMVCAIFLRPHRARVGNEMLPTLHVVSEVQRET
jgi:hypothetical protein